jgi:hypothetical protein
MGATLNSFRRIKFGSCDRISVGVVKECRRLLEAGTAYKGLNGKNFKESSSSREYEN